MAWKSLAWKSMGFTLVELVMILIIIAVLASMVMPRYPDQTTFNARGFYDAMLSLLHYAQKAAIAQHRTVCVSLSSTGASITIASAFPFIGTTCDGGNLVLPVSVPKAGSGLSANTTSFQFLPSGSTNQSANIAITITGSNGITVDAVTGYAY